MKRFKEICKECNAEEPHYPCPIERLENGFYAGLASKLEELEDQLNNQK